MASKAHKAAGGAADRSTRLWMPVLLAFWALSAVALVLSGSRTGATGTLLLAAWGLLDRQLRGQSRGLLLATPAFFAAAWVALRALSDAAGLPFGAERLVAQSENFSSSRLLIWSNTVELIRAHPWTGVGWGNFNLAWTLTPFPARPREFFDHAHNLPLQWAAELGLPTAALLLGLTACLLRWAWTGSLHAAPTASAAGRGCVWMLLIVGWHSLLEYPLWYTHFLLPSAFALGFALGVAPKASGNAAREAVDPTLSRGGLLPMIGGLACATAALWAAWDYSRVTPIFEPDPQTPLNERIEQGRQSLVFTHHAEYAAATVQSGASPDLAPFEVATRNLLDARLLHSWSKALARAGLRGEAHHVASRLREFGVEIDTQSGCEETRADKAENRQESLRPPHGSGNKTCAGALGSLRWVDFISR